MSPATVLCDSDLRSLVGLLDDAYHDEPGERIPWAVFDDLDRLIGADSIQLTEVDLVDRSLVEQEILIDGEHAFYGPIHDPNDDFFRFVVDTNFQPCFPVESADPRAAHRWSDFYTDRELANQPAKTDYFDDVSHAVALSLPTNPGCVRWLCLMREQGPDFTERDVMLLTVLRPHVREIILDAARRRAGVPKLTPREWEVLRLAGAGLGNAAIAQRLFISTQTVRKHMEHIFDQLGVRNRMAAAAMALPHAGRALPNGRRAT